MDGLVLRLLPDNQEPQELVLQQHRLASSILDASNAASSFVFSDYRYQAQLVGAGRGSRHPVFLLNGKDIMINYSPESGMIEFQDPSFGQRIFLECYGFVQITIIFDDEQGNRQVKETEYIQVMVRKGQQNDSVRRMTEYVYQQNTELLNSRRTLPKNPSGLKESAQKTIEAHILLLEQISVVYEENFRYFKMNSRFSTIPKERVDRFEKLQYVSSNTIRHIAQHPEELQKIRCSSGIKVGNFRYQPNKTLITNNEKSYDIYENRVVLGFLLTLLREVERIQKELLDIVDRVPQKPMETNGYVTSSYFIYAKTVESVKLLLQDVQRLQRKYASLYYSYAEILPIRTEIISNLPRFTPVFKSIPQYHQVYDCALAWFSKGAFAIREEQFMLSFIKVSALYEVYVLTKLINYFRSAGYALIASDKIQYPSPSVYYESTCCNNYFVLKNETGQITLYYQPVVYNTDRQSISKIGLYRNTSISFPKPGDGPNYGGRHYTPDFLIKYEYFGSISKKYLIADAKFSRLQTVRNREVAEIAYKYLFSVSPISQNDQLVGLCIFNGLSDAASDAYTNVYDFELTQRISPRADIVTLTENSLNNLELHEALLRNTVGLYTTEIPQKPVPLPVNTESLPRAIVPGQSAAAQDPAPLDQRRDTTITNQLVPDSASKQRPLRPSASMADAGATRAYKKAAPKRDVDAGEIQLTELMLDKEVESRLIAAGFVTVQDLLPNRSKSDLTNNTILNRKSRREIEARLKQRKVHLS